jgi:hypothetical protein
MPKQTMASLFLYNQPKKECILYSEESDVQQWVCFHVLHLEWFIQSNLLHWLIVHGPMQAKNIDMHMSL